MKKADHQLIQQVLDGSISQPAFDGFQQRMRSEPGLARLYGEYSLLHHSLCEEFEDLPVSGKSLPATRWKFPARILWVAAAAAAVALLAAILYPKAANPAGPPPVMATVEFSPDAVWKIEGSTAKGDAPVNLAMGGTLQLIQGQARIGLNDSAYGLIESPSIVTVVSEKSLHLAEGRGLFRSDQPGGRLEVTTPSMSAVDLGTEFGIETQRDRPDELHVLEGEVRMRINGRSEGEVFAAGTAGRVSGSDAIERFPADPQRFVKKLGEFETVVSGPFVKADWRADYGSPSISQDRIDGVNFSVFHRLTKPAPDEADPVLLATLSVDTPSSGIFHTDGWAGMSFFSRGIEVLFFGDSFGPERTWSLDVKQRVPVVIPGNFVIGPKTVTLRYDCRTGEVSLHEGGLPLGSPFCIGKVPAGSSFDEIRIGASSSAALAIRDLDIRVGGHPR